MVRIGNRMYKQGSSLHSSVTRCRWGNEKGITYVKFDKDWWLSSIIKDTIIYARCAISRRHLGTGRPSLPPLVLAHFLRLCSLSFCSTGVFPYLNVNESAGGIRNYGFWSTFDPNTIHNAMGFGLIFILILYTMHLHVIFILILYTMDFRVMFILIL